MSIESLASPPVIPPAASTAGRLSPTAAATRPAMAVRTAAWPQLAWCWIGPELLRSMRAHALFIGLIALYVAAELYLPELMGVETPFLPTFSYKFFLTMSGLTLAVPACLYVTYVMVAVRPQALVAYLADAVRRFLTARRICAALPVILLFPFFGSAFAYFRIMLPNFQPFAWDPAFAHWDRALHGGYDAWQLLQPVLGYPFVTAAVNGLYHLWFVVMFGVILWQAGSLARPRVRMQFFLSFILLWAVLGNFIAILLSSAGPVYYDRVTGLANPFQPLMDYLHAANEVAPVMALGVQEKLWASYAENGLATLGGITAMPSMHIATSACFTLVAYAANRRLGHALLLFTVIVQIGSVHLGWHYAIDGYVAAIGTIAIWVAVGWLLRLRPVVRLLWGDSDSDGHASLRVRAPHRLAS